MGIENVDKEKVEEIGEVEYRSQRFEDINLGDELVILARRGKDGNAIGRLADGRVILFSKESTMKVNPGDTVLGEIVHVTRTYTIVMPKKVLGDTIEALILNLRNVCRSGYYQHSVLSRALLYLVTEKLDKA